MGRLRLLMFTRQALVRQSSRWLGAGISVHAYSVRHVYDWHKWLRARASSHPCQQPFSACIPATRNMACCPVIGQGAGVAAALSVKQDRHFDEVNLADVQTTLKK